MGHKHDGRTDMAMEKRSGHKGAPATPPNGSRTANHRSIDVAPTPKTKVGKGLPHTYFGNSREAVHKNFDRHHHD